MAKSRTFVQYMFTEERKLKRQPNRAHFIYYFFFNQNSTVYTNIISLKATATFSITINEASK